MLRARTDGRSAKADWPAIPAARDHEQRVATSRWTAIASACGCSRPLCVIRLPEMRGCKLPFVTRSRLHVQGEGVAGDFPQND